jgi:hypothetical protein
LAHGALVHDFLFQGNLNDSVGAATLTALGGTIGGTAYAFAPDQGLSLSSPALASSGTYTVALRFHFQTITLYRRILDFKNLTSDTGLYVLNANLHFFNEATGSGDPIAADTLVTVAVTRDAATNTFAGYVNGLQAFSFVDGSFLGVLSGPGNILYFFRDDNAVGGESSGGGVDRIMIWDNALSGLETATLDLSERAVPEPSNVILVSVGIIAILGFRSRLVVRLTGSQNQSRREPKAVGCLGWYRPSSPSPGSLI